MPEVEPVPIDLSARVEDFCPGCGQMFMLPDATWRIEVVGGLHTMQRLEGLDVMEQQTYGPCAPA